MVGEFLSAFAQLRMATIGFFMSVCLSVHPHGTTRLPPDGFSRNFVFEYFFENLSRKFKLHEHLTKLAGTLHEDQYTCLIISRSVRPKIINVSHKICGDNQSTILYSVKLIYLFFKFQACFYEIMWKNIVKPDRLQMTIWRTRIACRILQSTNTLRICNTYCFSTATVFSRTHINVTLYVHCLWWKLMFRYYEGLCCNSVNL